MYWSKRIAFGIVLGIWGQLQGQVLLSRNHIFGPSLAYGLGMGKEKTLDDITAMRSMGSSAQMGFHYYRNVYGGFWAGGALAFHSYRWNFTTHPQASPGFRPRTQYGVQAQLLSMPMGLMQYIGETQGRAFVQLGITPAYITRKTLLQKQELDVDSTGFATLDTRPSYQRFGMGFYLGLGIEFETYDDMYARLSIQIHHQYLRRQDHSVDRVSGVFLTAQYFWVQ